MRNARNARLLYVSLLPLVLIGLQGCGLSIGADVVGSGVTATDERDVAGFRRVELTGSPDVLITVGGATAVIVEADDNLLEHIETSVSGDTLKIKTKKSLSSSKGITIRVTTPGLEGAGVTGSGDMRITGVSERRFSARVTGSGDLTAQGSADELDAKVTGSGDLDLFGLVARKAEVSVTGSGDIHVYASESLSAKVTGSGDVVYDGRPSKINRKTTGSGDINAR